MHKILKTELNPLQKCINTNNYDNQCSTIYMYKPLKNADGKILLIKDWYPCLFYWLFHFFTLKFMVTSLYIFQRYFDYHYLFWSPLKRTRIDVAVLSMSSTICCQIQTAPSNSNKIHLTSPRFLCFRTLNITLIDMETSVRV